MREQGKGLKTICSLALRGGHGKPSSRVEQRLPIERNMPFIGNKQASDAIEQRRLPRTRWTEQNGKAWSKRFGHIKRKRRRIRRLKSLPDLHFEHRTLAGRPRGPHAPVHSIHNRQHGER